MKVQTSLEFMIVFMVLLAAMGVFLGFNFQKSREFFFLNEDLNADALLQKIKIKLDSVFLEGNGFVTSLYLPADVSGANYSVIVSKNFVTIISTSSAHTKPLLTSNVTGTLRAGKNTLTNVLGGIVIS